MKVCLVGKVFPSLMNGRQALIYEKKFDPFGSNSVNKKYFLTILLCFVLSCKNHLLLKVHSLKKLFYLSGYFFEQNIDWIFSSSLS